MRKAAVALMGCSALAAATAGQAQAPTPVETAGQPVAADAPMVTYVVRRTPPQLVDLTPGRGAFAMIGAFAAISAGAKVVSENGIENPANDVAREVAIAYAAAHGYRVADTPLVIDDGNLEQAKKTALGSLAPGAHYVVDSDVASMNLTYFSGDWAHYRLLYSGRLRIIQTAGNRVVSEGRCSLKPKKTPDAPSHDALLENQAAMLKQLIRSSADQCGAEMKAALKM